MNWRVFLATAGLAMICAAHAIAADPVRCGERFTLHSKILGEERTVFVAVPVSYAQGPQRYPVLYLADAQWQFEQTVAPR
jgi:enterochelin esterase-like enzyme